MKLSFPTVVLSNGLRICNFSSPHPFNFTDGSVLGACSPEQANYLKLDVVEQEKPSGCGRFVDIDLRFKMTEEVRLALGKAAEIADIVMCPLPVMAALKDAALPIGKARVQRQADRVSKAIFIDRFCV